MYSIAITMSPPALAAPAHGSAATDVKGESGLARILGSGMAHVLAIQISPLTLFTGSAGIAELMVFHPVCSSTRTAIIR